VRRARHLVYETIRELSPSELSFVFTVQLIQEDPEDAAAFADLVDLAADRQSLLVPFRLLCDTEELVKRIVSPGRAAMLKQITAEAARERAASKSVFTPAHPYLRTLDVTQLSASESAAEIVAHVNSIQKNEQASN
jgi:hypothetical protein